MTFTERLYRRSLVAAITAGFALLIVLGLAVAWLVVRTQESSQTVTHTYQVEVTLSQIRVLVERAEAARRGFLLEPRDGFRRVFEETVAQIPPLLDDMAGMVADNPPQVERVRQLTSLTNEHLALLRESIAEREAEGLRPEDIGRVGAEDIALIVGIRDVARAMSQAESDLLRERTDSQQAFVATSYAFMTGAFVLLLLVALGTIWAARQNVRELRQSRDKLRFLNDDLESVVQTRTADLQRANDEIQRFAYIVSHDLRSPLVNVMGFTSELDAATKQLAEMLDKVEAEAPETVSEDARLAVREDLPEAIGFIRSSTEKMDRLINAILRLSREGRRVITPERIDMNAMVRGIVDSLQHRLTEVGAEVKVEPLPDLVSDRVAIEQIFSNLIENAVKYLKPGRPGVIKVRGKRQNDRVVFEIEDNGRGIDPKDHDRVFDLFRRSGSQDQPGEGIGLAHVRALAYRLGGMIGCDSALDQGATFRLSMTAKLHET
ncbi:histidine kinase [Aurantimonas aggregata]|uniref:histidine kinase n=1 Tax=Aurantimonas aggregata TaxID=2047720 RepID=A0A6L9MJ46_9HYPH|nr:sensor histidine kinase [Aurantimonas aggregata]NDV87741.1 histidine kinase [Aurantimonas aggregata]